MSRVKTEHRVINEGATGRIVARRFLRKTLGNPKKRERDKAELCQELFFKGVTAGKKIENLRIQYATAGMEYGEGYPVTQEELNVSTDPEAGEVAVSDSGDVRGDGAPVGADYVPPSFPEAYSKPDARGAEGVDAHGGSDFQV